MLKKIIHLIVLLFFLLGAVNWLSVGIFNYDFAAASAGKYVNVVYILYGLAAIIELGFLHKSIAGSFIPKSLM